MKKIRIKRVNAAIEKRSKLNYKIHKYLYLPLRIFRMSIIDTIRQDGIEHAGYLAFLSILSLFPFLIFLFALIDFIGASSTATKLINEILNFAPKEISSALAPRINEITSKPPHSFLTIAIIGVIWTASSSVEGCRTFLNRAYRITLPPPYILRRLVSILEFFIIIFLILTGVVLFILIPLFFEKFRNIFHLEFYDIYNILHLRHLLIFILLTCCTSALYYAIPNAKQKITQTLPGSILVVVLWFLVEKIFSFYLDNFHQFNFVYGSLAGIIISLMFFFLVGLIFIFGAEFNYHFHRAYKIFLKEKK